MSCPLQKVILTAALMIGTAGAVLAQSPLPGELPLDKVPFKTSHNAYERLESIDRQIAEYNCWGIELDINWDGSDEGDLPSDIWVAHDCPTDETRSLREHVTVALSAPYIHERITFIWLDVKDNSACPDFGPWPSNIAALVEPRIEGALTANGMTWANVYTPTDFVLDGNNIWPSWQELVRRGKYVIVILQLNMSQTTGTRMFDSVNAPVTNPPSRVTFVNRKKAQLNEGEDPLIADRWLWRTYPEQFGSDESDDNLTAAINRGFSLIGTNAINRIRTNVHALQSSNPVFVNANAPVQEEWGTYYRPYRTLDTALNRASPATDVLLKAGGYSLGSGVINQSVRLRAEGGTVRIIRP